MRTLDLIPLMTAMRDRPGEFELQEQWLMHRASGHTFLVLDGAIVRIEARCSCAELRAEPSQEAEFVRVLHAWTVNYWRPLQIERTAERRAAEINRQFAAHFRPPGKLARRARRIVDAWRAAREALRRPDPQPLAIEVLPEGAQTTVPLRRSVPEREAVDA